MANLILAMRNRHFFALDVLALLFTPALALTLRLDRLNWWPRFGHSLVFFTIVVLLVKVPIFYRLGLYRRYWRYAGVNDLTRVLIAVGLSTAILTVLFMSVQASLGRLHLAVPRSLPLLDGMLTCLAVGGSRLGLRGLYHWHRQRHGVVGGRRVLVVGAGEAGTLAVREMRANPQLNLEPVAFVDDDPAKVGTHIQGLSVLGTCAQVLELIGPYQIQRIVVAIPSATLGRQQEILALCEKTDATVHNVPGMYELLAGYKTISRVPEVDIHRLLRRKPVEIDPTGGAAYMENKTVLITGAGGSIGSELCRQVARFHPVQMILLGHGENSIFEIGLNLRLSFPDLAMHQVIADVRDRERINAVVQAYRPDVIFHAAAHKHVPFMEACVEEAITNNVLGTWNVLQAAERNRVQRFVLISSDKAVHPTSVMGVTKRLAELLTVAIAQRSGQAYIAVRFGNVLGSRGSVVSVFQQQIAAGGPLTVTHPDMCRYFMTIPEAVQLVLQASALGKGSDVFVLDMGQPIRILDLAIDMIKVSGLELGRDIEIVYTGIRPGEKLSEALFLETEKYERTKCPWIFVATDQKTVPAEALEQLVIEFVDLARRTRSSSAGEQMSVLLREVCYHIDDYELRARPSPPRLAAAGALPAGGIPAMAPSTLSS